MNAAAVGTVFYVDPGVVKERLNSMSCDTVGAPATGQYLWNLGVLKQHEPDASMDVQANNTIGYVQLCGDPFRGAEKNIFRANPFCGTCLYEWLRDESEPTWLGALVTANRTNSPEFVRPRTSYGGETVGIAYVLVDETPSTQKGRTIVATDEARRSMRAVAQGIQRLLPGMSEESIGALVGVSRVGWRDWVHAVSAPRPEKRRRLLRLKKVLELRRRVAPGEALTNWLETPVGLDLNVTPARLLAEGRDQVVAILAARPRAPEGDEFTLDVPLDLGGLLDPDRVRDELQMRREVVEETTEM